LKRLGYLRPNDINSEADSVAITRAKKEHGIDVYKEPSFEEQSHNIKNYQGDLQISDYVYRDFDTKLFDKSYDVSVKWP